LNVAINARDAMAEGGRLTIETANTYLDEAYCRQNPEIEPGHFVLVAIADTGSGMSPEVASRAFDPFFTTKPSGTGLGLSISHELVRAHGGDIQIDSHEGRGTSVRVTIPTSLTS
ncbi:MAG: ATP-binding protein, partial [Candidatus Acidiferrum sp.]